MTFSKLFKPLFQPLFQPVGGLLTRYFRTNSGTTDYVQLAQPVVLAGDFEIEFLAEIDPTAKQKFLGHTTVSDSGLIGIDNGYEFVLRISGGWLVVQMPRLSAGFHKISIVRSAGVLTRFVDGEQIGGEVTYAGPWTISRVQSAFGSPASQYEYMSGVLANLTITQNGTLIHHWPMNEGSGSTHVDVIGGNNGTIINGQASDWERFERLPASNEWLGRELFSDALIASIVPTGAISYSASGVSSRIESQNVASYPFARLSTPSMVEGFGYKCTVSIDASSSSVSAFLAVGDASSITGERILCPEGQTVSATRVLTPTGDKAIRFYLNGASVPIGQVALFDNISVRRILEIA